MLARLKQEPLREISSGSSQFGEELHGVKANGNTDFNFAAAFYGKSFLEMDIKDGKTDSLEGKHRKGKSLYDITIEIALLRPMWKSE
jgi:hypothetical protein